MLSVDTIHKALNELSQELEKRNSRGEICLVGGAALCLAYQARAATKDLDGVFEPAQTVRDAAAAVAERLSLPEDWLNDAVKGFLPSTPQSKNVVFSTDYLSVWVPAPEYLLAMKVVSSRVGTRDVDDIRFLANLLGLTTAKEVLEATRMFFGENLIPQKSIYVVEEVFDPADDPS